MDAWEKKLFLAQISNAFNSLEKGLSEEFIRIWVYAPLKSKERNV